MHSQRVFIAHVDIALRRANGIGADQHAFQHQMRIAFEQASVHIGARVAFIGIADYVLGLTSCLAGRLPLPAGWKTTAAASPQIGLFHLFDHSLGLHAGQGLGKAAVAADCKIVVDACRVDIAVHPEDIARLALVKRHIMLIDNFLLCGRVDVGQAVDDFAGKHGL